jgi:acyl dehydratase
VPLNRALEGKEYPPNEPFEVTAESIEEFVDAIGDKNPVYRDAKAARKAGFDAVIAPPTYLTKLNFLYAPQMILDPDLGLNYAMVVHGEQEFVYDRPVKAGDVLVGKLRIASIAVKGNNEFMVSEAAIETVGGERVALARSTIVSRGTGGA